MRFYRNRRLSERLSGFGQEFLKQGFYLFGAPIAGGATLEQLAEQFDTLDNGLPVLIKDGRICGFAATDG